VDKLLRSLRAAKPKKQTVIGHGPHEFVSTVPDTHIENLLMTAATALEDLANANTDLAARVLELESIQ